MKSIKSVKFIFAIFVSCLFLVDCPLLIAQDDGDKVNRQALEKLIAQLDSRYSAERRLACKLLETAGEEAVKPLIEALENESAAIRSNAAMVLGRLKAASALPGLLELTEDMYVEVRRKVAEAIELIGPEAIDLLQEYLERSQGQRKELFERIIGRALKDRVKEYIDGTAIELGNYMYCPGHIEELKKLGPGVLRALEEIADWDAGTASIEDFARAYRALNVIGEMGDKSTAPFLKRKVSEAKASGNLALRAGAAMGLSNLGESSAVEELIRDIEMGVYQNQGAGQHSSLGATCLEIGKLDESEHHFREALKLQPQDSYMFRLGCVYGKKGEAEKAVEHVKKAVEAGYIKPAMVQKIAYFDGVRDSAEWKEFMKEALKAEEEKRKKEEEENRGEEDDAGETGEEKDR